jgi:hypothetical protein
VKFAAKPWSWSSEDEHVPDEARVPRVGQHVAHLELVLGVGAAEQVLHEQLVARGEVRLHVGEQRVEVRLVERLVDLPPVHVGLARRLAHDELVVRRAPGVRGRDGDEGAHVGERALAATDGVLHELRGDEVPVHLARGRDAEGGEGARRVGGAGRRRLRRGHRGGGGGHRLVWVGGL